MENKMSGQIQDKIADLVGNILEDYERGKNIDHVELFAQVLRTYCHASSQNQIRCLCRM